MNNMFCFQCEQAAGGKGCTNVGVCGKKPDVSNLQDQITASLITLARAVGGKIDLELAAVIGAVPFTAEAAEARKRILTRVRGQKGLLLTDGRNLCAYSRAVFAGPLQPETLMTELVSFMLAVKPEIEGLEPLLPGRLRSREPAAA